MCVTRGGGEFVGVNLRDVQCSENENESMSR